MSVDPSDPATPDDLYDAYEDESEGEDTMAGMETNPEDVAEQHTDLLRQRDEPITGREDPEVDPADAAEQARVMELNEDDYR